MMIQTPEQMKEYCKILLQETDYTQLEDVPISNKIEFAIYREAIRTILFNPTINSFIPPQPVPVWVATPL
jgi:hypothetical protein